MKILIGVVTEICLCSVGQVKFGVKCYETGFSFYRVRFTKDLVRQI